MASTRPAPNPATAPRAVGRLVLSFLVAFLPGRLQQGRFRHVASPAAAVVSGLVEASAAALLHVSGFVRSIEGFLSTDGLTWFQHAPVTVDIQATQGVGLLGMMSYLVSPWALCLVYHAFEGTVRFAEALVEGRLRGVAILSVPDALARAAWRAWEALLLEIRLGPPAPDGIREIRRPVEGLRIESREDKPWSVHQALRDGGVFYVVVSRALVRSSSGARRYSYDLRRLPPEEVIRGGVLPLERGSGRPATWYGRLLWGLSRRPPSIASETPARGPGDGARRSRDQ